MGFYNSKKSVVFFSSHDLNSRDMLHIFYLLDMVVSDGSVSDATELFTPPYIRGVWQINCAPEVQCLLQPGAGRMETVIIKMSFILFFWL